MTDDSPVERVAQADEYPPVPCPYCCEDYTSEGEYPGDAYMFEGHILFNCPDADENHRRHINQPATAANEGSDSDYSEPQPCSCCLGQGTITSANFSTLGQDVDCPVCGGSGYV